MERSSHGYRRRWLWIAALGCAAMAGASLPARAALDDVGNAPPSVHRLKFRVDPRLSAGPGGAETGRRLGQYVADLNTVFVRESVRSFAFDPAVDLLFADPLSDSRCRDAPPHNVAGEIEICIAQSPQNASSGGYAYGVLHPLSGSVRGLSWSKLHDPLRLSRTRVPPEVIPSEEDYLHRQFRSLVRQLERVFGAGTGDYNSMGYGIDPTGVTPLLGRDIANPADAYWWSRQHWRRDPLLGQIYNPTGQINDRVSMLRGIRFTAGTRAQINTDWSQWPDSSAYLMPLTQASEVWVSDPLTDAPVAGAQVTVWQVPPPPANGFRQVARGGTDAAGRFVFDWKCSPSCFNADRGILLVKASAPGRAPAASWFSIFDAFEQKAAFGQQAITIGLSMPLSSPGTAPPGVMLQYPATSVVGQPVAFSAVPFNPDAPLPESVRLLGPGDAGCTLYAPPYTCSFVPALSGLQDLVAITRNHAGHVSPQYRARMQSAPAGDRIAPSLSAQLPGIVQAGSPLPLVLSASDNVAVSSVEVIVNGRTVCELSAAPYECQWWTPATPGYLNLEARVRDAAGNHYSVSATTRVL